MLRGVALSVLALAGCTAPVGERHQNVVGGAPSGDAAVVALVARRQGCAEVPAIFCSGTVIAPRAVLTAAHCLEDLQRGGALEVFAGDRVGGSGEYRLVTDHRTSSRWDGVRGDLGIVRLDSPFTAAATHATAATPLDDTVIGGSVRVVGFGLGAATDPAPDGQRREGTMTVIGLAAETFDTRAGPAVTCQGDSGGPVLLDRGAGQQIVGVTASGDAGCSQSAVNTRVDAFAGEIAMWLAEIENAPIDDPDAAIAIEATCASTCGSDDDCPARLRCIDDGGERRCATSAAVPQAYGEPCVDDNACGAGSCARVWSHGAAACRCATPCETDDPGCGGCGAAGDGGGAALGLVSVLLLRRRRTVQRVQFLGAPSTHSFIP